MLCAAGLHRTLCPAALCSTYVWHLNGINHWRFHAAAYNKWRPNKTSMIKWYTLCTKKGSHQTFGNNFLESKPIFNFFHWWKEYEISNKKPLNIFHHTLSMFSHYLVVLLEISSSFQKWKNFEDRLRFEKVIAKSLVASFFGTQIITDRRLYTKQEIKIHTPTFTSQRIRPQRYGGGGG